MTLTTLNDNQPEWVDPKLGLEEYNEFKLGEKVKFYQDNVYIIHIQKLNDDIFCRLMLSNNASITGSIDKLTKLN